MRDIKCALRRVADHFLNPRAEAGRFGGIAITFDDAYVDEWYSIRDLLASYEAKVTFFVSHFDTLKNDSIEKLRILRDDGHEIGFHGFRHVNAAKFVENSSIEAYLDSEIIPGMNMMMAHGFVPTNFSYPYGAHTSNIDRTLLKLFRRVRGTSFTGKSKRLKDLGEIYFSQGNGRVIYGAGLDNIYGNTVDEAKQGIIKAIDRKEVLVFYAHRTSNDAGDYCMPVAKLEAIIKYASENGMIFYRMNDLQ